MKRSIFGYKRDSEGLRLDPFFIETALVIPVFALCCCTVLQMLAAAVKRAEREQMYASAVACAESWCELYSSTGSLEISAEELFGANAADSCFIGSGYEISADRFCRYSPTAAEISVSIDETVSDCVSDGLVYGQMYSSEIFIKWDGGELAEEAQYYRPLSALIALETEAEE